MQLRRALPLLLAGLLVATLTTTLTAVSPSAPADAAAKPKKAPKSADVPWSGYRLRPTEKAAGGFLGARLLDGQVVYRIDPGARSRTKAFVPGGAWTDALVGSGKAVPSAVATSQASWIVGKYGSFKDKQQSAAVEVALDHLLVGGPWAVTGKKTNARLAQLPRGARAAIRSIATKMLKGAATYASTYAVSMTTTPSVPRGATTTSTLRIATAGGAGVPNLLVTFGFPGAPATPVRTGADGTASATFAAGTEGVQTTTATVANVPESRLLVLTPTSAKASRVVVADRKTDLSLTGTTTVRYGRPTIGMYSPDRIVGQNTGAIIDVRSSVATTPRTATATLYGPYVANNGTCQGRVETQGSVTVNGDGVYQLPPAAPATSGYYYWDVAIPGNTANAAARACSGNMRVKAAPQASVAPSGSYSYPSGSTFPASVSAFGLPPSYQPVKPISVFAFGPYYSGGAMPTCQEAPPAYGAQVPNTTGAGGSMTALSGAMRFVNPSIVSNANYFLTVIFPADAYGRSDEFSTGCVVFNGSIFTNGVSIGPSR